MSGAGSLALKYYSSTRKRTTSFGVSGVQKYIGYFGSSGSKEWIWYEYFWGWFRYEGNSTNNISHEIPPCDHMIIFGKSSSGIYEILFVSREGAMRLRQGSNPAVVTTTKLIDGDVPGGMKLSIGNYAYGNTSGYTYECMCF